MDNVGTVPAALTTYLAIQAFQPDIVISTGEGREEQLLALRCVGGRRDGRWLGPVS